MLTIPFKNESQSVLRDSWRSPEGSFESLFRLLGGENLGAQFSPPLDVKESQDAYTVELDLPGLEKKDIRVRVEEGVLSVSGERKAQHQEENKERSWTRTERPWGAFERRLSLGEGVDASKVSAEYRDGVLSVTVPKKESALPHVVDVR